MLRIVLGRFFGPTTIIATSATISHDSIAERSLVLLLRMSVGFVVLAVRHFSENEHGDDSSDATANYYEYFCEHFSSFL